MALAQNNTQDLAKEILIYPTIATLTNIDKNTYVKSTDTNNVQPQTDNEEYQHFQVQTESGEIRDAELLSVVYIDGKKYAIYCFGNTGGTVDVLASYVFVTPEGYDRLVDIDNPEDKKKVEEYILTLIKAEN